jgi:hypothetical protein
VDVFKREDTKNVAKQRVRKYFWVVPRMEMFKRKDVKDVRVRCERGGKRRKRNKDLESNMY